MRFRLCAGARRWALFGAVAGALAALCLPLAPPGTSRRAAPAGPLLADRGGALAEIVVQFHAEARPLVARALRDFLGALPADATVRVVCPGPDDFAVFRETAGATACALRPVFMGGLVSAWSRDRWLALEAAPPRPAVLLAPAGEEGAEVWPARKGDEGVAERLAERLGERLDWARSTLFFDGGDFVCDGRTIFATPNLRRRNPGAADLRETLERTLGREVVLLESAPPYHAGMFMAPVDETTMLVGDPSLARPLVEAPFTLFEADFTTRTQGLFDAVARRCEAAGRRVVRVPVVPGADGRTYLTPCNAIFSEAPDGAPLVYMPVYRGAAALNRAARETFERLGLRVVAVDCTETFRRGGSLRCLVNVLARKPAQGAGGGAD